MSRTTLNHAIKLYQLKSVHPAAELFPMLGDDEYDALVNDVRANGFCSEATADDQGRLIDGRNRICASVDADVDLHINIETFDNETDVLNWIISNNVSRRHLTPSQRNCLGAEMEPFYTKAAKQRQKQHGNTAPGKPKTVVADLPQVNGHKAREDAAAATGGSPRGVQQAKRVKQVDPILFEKVKQGEISLDKAEREAKTKERMTTKVDPQQKVRARDQVVVITVDGKEKAIAAPKMVRFNRTNDNVDWARWTWNPVTGCNHGCAFCYAREIAYMDKMSAYYPNKFDPTFHEYRLGAPVNTPIPTSDDPREQRVFVCSMADLFGKWVPLKWIQSVFDACLEEPGWTYLFLTKWPARYSQLPLLAKAWYGASIVQQSDVSRIVKAMQKFDAPNIVRWISMEPMLEPIVFDDLSWCDLMVIGSQTSTNQPDGFVPAFSPKFDWIVDVVNQCRDADVPYYLKANLGTDLPGMELPKQSPR